MANKKFDFEAALDELDFAFGVALYSFTQAEVQVVIDKAKAIHKAMVAQKMAMLPDLLDD